MRWTGNTGKAKIQMDLLAIKEPVAIIDVGAVGPGPLDLWKEMPMEELPFRVVGIDPDAGAVEQARKLGLPIELHAMSGYELSRHFAEASFDIAICTQVLEHVAEPARLLSEVRRVLKPGGLLWLTLDSAHFTPDRHRDPLWKRLARPIAARVRERYYDFGLTEEYLRSSLDEAGFEIDELFHCNFGPLKPLYASLTDEDIRAFVPAWLDFERSLSANNFRDKTIFRGMYAAARARGF
jgi:SAM-dependent methyltransferase